MSSTTEKEIDVEQNEVEERFEYYLSGLVTRSAEEIRNRLRVNEDSFDSLSHAHNARGRNHYIYAVLDELEQIAIVLKLSRKLFDEGLHGIPNEERGRRFLRNMLSVIERDQSLYIRRLTEILVDLINFSRTNSNEYYDHYLLYKELDQHNKRKDDFKNYFDCENLNTQSSIDLIKQSIARGESKIQLGDCWYLKGKNPKPNGAADIEDFRKRYDRAILLATKQERLVLGFYYGLAYREPSQSIHLNIGGLTPEISWEKLKIRRVLICFIAAHSLLRCRRLLKVRTRESLSAKLAKILDKHPSVISVYHQSTQPNIVKGDMVTLLGSSLCEVMAVKKSKYGYKSFKLRFLSPPLTHKEDCFPAICVNKLMDGKKLRNDTIAFLRSVGARPTSSRRIREAMRKGALETWESIFASTRKA